MEQYKAVRLRVVIADNTAMPLRLKKRHTRNYFVLNIDMKTQMFETRFLYNYGGGLTSFDETTLLLATED